MANDYSLLENEGHYIIWDNGVDSLFFDFADNLIGAENMLTFLDTVGLMP
tara:strand:+ start:233 stop:382 length:150 start_codon:yes stop_codon:yes gene_type:complete